MLPSECALVSSALADRQYLTHIRRPAFLVETAARRDKTNAKYFSL